MTRYKMLLIKATTCLQVGPMSLDWPVDPFCKIRFSISSMPPEVPSGEQQQGASPASTRSRWRQGVLPAQSQILQRTTGWDGCGPFFSEGLRCVTWNTRGLVGSVFSRQTHRESKLNFIKKLLDHNNIICLQEVHGKDEFLQDIQELGSAISVFLGPLLLKTKTREGRPSAFTGTFFLQMRL